MKSTPLILAAGVIFGAIYGTNALLPDIYDNPTSEAVSYTHLRAHET